METDLGGGSYRRCYGKLMRHETIGYIICYSYQLGVVCIFNARDRHMHFTYIVTVRVCFLFMLHPYHFFVSTPSRIMFLVRTSQTFKKCTIFLQDSLNSFIHTSTDRVEITCSKNDLEATGVIAGSVAGENISRDDHGRLRQKVAQSIVSTCVFSS